MAWRERVAAALALLMLPAAAAALEGSSDCTDLRGLPINFAVDWQLDIKPIINESFVTGRCTSCHNPGQFDGNLDLTDTGIDAIYKLVPSYAVPGAPGASILFDKINCFLPGHGGSRMPFGQAPLSIAQQGLIFDWIEQGALGDVEGEAPIPRAFLFRDGLESLRR
jgi:hypothetical protein